MAGSLCGKTCSSSFSTPTDAAHATAASSSAVPTPIRRCPASTISPRSATWKLAGCGSRASDRRPTIPSAASARKTAAWSERRTERRYRRSSDTLRQRLVEISQRPGSPPTARASSTSAAASRGCARRTSTRGSGLDGRLADDDAMPAAARIAGRVQSSVLEELHACRAAEVEVAAPPAHDVVAERLHAVELVRVVPALAVHVRLLHVDPGALDRLAHAVAVLQDVDDD